MVGNKNNDALTLAATIGVTAEGIAQRLYNEVAAAAKVFGKPAQPRPVQEIKELAEFVELLKGQPNDLPDLSETVRLLLGITEDYEADELLSDLSRLHNRARDVLSVLEISETVFIDRKGGRRRDPRLDRFAIALTQIYTRYSDSPITFSIAPDGGQLTEVLPIRWTGSRVI